MLSDFSIFWQERISGNLNKQACVLSSHLVLYARTVKLAAIFVAYSTMIKYGIKSLQVQSLHHIIIK